MSQNLAGLTLLAFGNQVADITVAIVSGGEENGGIEASLSTILGADSLVIGFVMPTVIFLGNGVIVKGQNFTRDLLTYLIALILIFSIGIFQRKLNLIYAFIIFGLYIVYVGLCIIMEKIENKKISKKEKLKKKEEDDNDSVDHDINHDFKIEIFENAEEKGIQGDDNDSIEDKEDKKNNENKNEEEDKNDQNKENEEKKKDKANLKKKEKEEKENKNDKEGKKDYKEMEEKEEKEEKDFKDEDEEDNFNDKMSLIDEVASLGGPKIFNINNFLKDKYYLKKSNESEENPRQTSILIGEKKLVYNRLHYTLAKYYLNSKEEKWDEISFFKKVIKIFVEFPLNLVRDLTTPPFENEKWKKEFFAAMPVSISLCLSLFFKLFPYYIKFPHFIFILIYYILAVIICIYLYKKSYRSSLPKYEWALLISALIMSMIWIYTVTTILIQMVNDSQFLLPFEVSSNFVSWYDELSAPTTATETSLVWSNRTIGADDNILVADVAWRYKENTTNAAQYTGDAILTGVPVLFHRMLSRVGINVAATPLTDPDNPSTTYSVQIQSISLNSVYSQGTLSLTNSDPGTVATTRAWTPANTTYFWNQEGTAGTIGMTAPTLTETPAPALAQRSMLPQPLNETSIDIVYTVVTYSNGTEIIREHDIPASIKLNTIKDSSNLAISQWLPNRIYTYNIIFDPRGTEIRLAPVLESDWSVIGVSATVE